MPILDMQRRLHQAGRIRIGKTVATGKGESRPSKLDTFRFTTPSEDAAKILSALFGGEVQPWAEAPTGKQWEVVSAADAIRVMVPPEAMGFSQNYEKWSGGGCERRCDGFQMVQTGEPCVCDPENRECKPHSRLSVMLADMPTSGLWRLDTSGYYAATELSGGFELARLIQSASGRAILGATLRLEQREVKRPGVATKKFAVPVLDFDINPQALLGEASGQPHLMASPAVTPVPALPAPSFADQLAAVDSPTEKPRRANAAEPIKPTGVSVRPALTAPVEDEPMPEAPRVWPLLGEFQELWDSLAERKAERRKAVEDFGYDHSDPLGAWLEKLQPEKVQEILDKLLALRAEVPV